MTYKEAAEIITASAFYLWDVTTEKEKQALSIAKQALEAIDSPSFVIKAKTAVDAQKIAEEMRRQAAIGVVLPEDTEIIRLNTSGSFTRAELEAWLYRIAFNNTDNSLGSNCEEIIKRLDGFERFCKDRREGKV